MEHSTAIEDGHGLVLYDGDCMLCSRWVRWVVARDPEGIFRFTPITSDYGRAVAGRLGIDADNPDTNAVVFGDKSYTYSDAALTIAGRLPGWRWVPVLKLCPKPIRDALYKVIARNRIKWFGRPDTCDLPGPEVRARIID